MTDSTDQPDPQVPKRGEAAWKAEKQRIAERNDRARKAGKQERQDRERREVEIRLAAERRTDAELARKFDAR
jgi:hypothetical protein